MTKRILVVDDDRDILDALKIILTMDNYVVDATDKGEETLEKATYQKPDLILLDVLLSGVDGREICRSLKAKKETQKIPIIMISAHPDAKESTKKAGADHFIAKPFDIDNLLFTIDWVMSKN